MASIKNRLMKLETVAKQGAELIKYYGWGWMYGDENDFELITPAEFKRRADRGLAGFYEDLARRNSAKAETEITTGNTNQTTKGNEP